MAEGATYLHFNITNIITIWIMAALGFAISGIIVKAWQNRQDS